MKLWRIFPLLVFIGLLVLFAIGLTLDPRNLPSTRIGHTLPEVMLPVLANPTEQFALGELTGHMRLINVWASWCEACVEEQPFLMQLAHEGVTLWGINYKDTRADALQWLSRFGNPYQRVGVDAKGQLAIELGVYGVPETFLMDPDGIIVYRHAGAMTPDIWAREFLPRMRTQKRSA